MPDAGADRIAAQAKVAERLPSTADLLAMLRRSWRARRSVPDLITPILAEDLRNTLARVLVDHEIALRQGRRAAVKAYRRVVDDATKPRRAPPIARESLRVVSVVVAVLGPFDPYPGGSKSPMADFLFELGIVLRKPSGTQRYASVGEAGRAIACFRRRRPAESAIWQPSGELDDRITRYERRWLR